MAITLQQYEPSLNSYALYTQSVRLMKTDRWTAFTGRTDRVWAPSFFFPSMKKIEPVLNFSYG